jgi:hypothetical protein
MYLAFSVERTISGILNWILAGREPPRNPTPDV